MSFSSVFHCSLTCMSANHKFYERLKNLYVKISLSIAPCHAYLSVVWTAKEFDEIIILSNPVKENWPFQNYIAINFVHLSRIL